VPSSHTHLSSPHATRTSCPAPLPFFSFVTITTVINNMGCCGSKQPTTHYAVVKTPRYQTAVITTDNHHGHQPNKVVVVKKEPQHHHQDTKVVVVRNR